MWQWIAAGVFRNAGDISFKCEWMQVQRVVDLLIPEARIEYKCQYFTDFFPLHINN
jgi:hypothetical protein